MRPSTWIDADGRERLEATIHEVERATEGELIVVVVPACDAYADVGWRVGVTFALLAYLGVAIAFPPQPFWLYLGVQGLALALGHALARLAPLRRLLLPGPWVEHRLAQRARRAFTEHGLARTRRQTGILVLVSLLERRVIVLGDAGINAVLDPDESWQQVVDLAVKGLHAGQPVDGLDTALRRCGEILARHFPAPTPREDQLPNAVILEDEL
ncbi:MAG: hypothetical protein AAF430_08200 [Myxococcota bacterium]